MVESSIGTHLLGDLTRQYRRLKEMAEGAIAQVDDDALFRRLDPESNSLAVLLHHVGGNLRSRWRDFLTADGEKADRNRDAEFEDDPNATRASALAVWEEGWRTLFDQLEVLQPADLLRSVTIRGEPHSVIDAINRSFSHTAFHVGQIVFLAKHLSPEWRTLSVPRGKSREFNDAKGYRPGS